MPILNESILFIDQLWERIPVMPLKISSFLNSNFFTTLIGAFAGAYGAQVISERGKYRDNLKDEIRHLNAASMVAFDTCNILLSLKKQHVKKLVEGYKKDRKEFLDAFDAAQKKSKPFIYEYSANFETLELPFIETSVLQNLIFEKMDINGRPQILVTAIVRSTKALELSLQRRNSLIEQYKNNNFSQQEMAVLYFGLPFNGGHVDNMYPSTLEAISSYLEDSIFFSKLFCDDIYEYGLKCSKKYSKKFRGKKIKINHLDWKIAESQGLLPDPKNYADWMKMFRVDSKKSFWENETIKNIRQAFLW